MPAANDPVEPSSGSVQDALERFAGIVARDRTDRIESQVPGIVERFATRGIAVIVLKGPVTRQRLYAADEPRPVADIDLLVDPSRFGRASRLLRGAGYHRFDRHGHSDAFTPGPATGTAAHRAGDPDAEPDLDLHLTLPYVTRSPRRAWALFAAHRTHLRVGGASVPVLDEPAHAVHLAIHATVNRFDPDDRSFDDWRRGAAALDDTDRHEAARLAAELGVGRVWDLARAALAEDADLAALRVARPVWEVEPRWWSVRGFLSSGTPLRVKTRDLARVAALQWSDAVYHEWQANHDGPRLTGGALRRSVTKASRLVRVGGAGLGRVVRGGVDRFRPRRRGATPGP